VLLLQFILSGKREKGRTFMICNYGKNRGRKEDFSRMRTYLIYENIKISSEKLPPSVIRIDRKRFRNTLHSSLTISVPDVKLAHKYLVLIEHLPHNLVQTRIPQILQRSPEHCPEYPWIWADLHLDINLRSKFLLVRLS
jgi:hypothetical protein